MECPCACSFKVILLPSRSSSPASGAVAKKEEEVFECKAIICVELSHVFSTFCWPEFFVMMDFFAMPAASLPLIIKLPLEVLLWLLLLLLNDTEELLLIIMEAEVSNG